MKIEGNSQPPEMVVLCGGKGQRLGNLTENTPKPLLPISGSPFLLRLLMQWRSEGIKKFILSTHYFPEKFHEFVAKHHELGEIEIVEEPEPLGTGGGLKHAVQKAVKSPHFLVANGDSYVDQRLSQLWERHREGNYPFTLCAVKASNVLGGAIQKGRININIQNEITGFTTEENSSEGWINGGIYGISRAEILSWPEGKYDLEKKILPDCENRRVHVVKSTGNLLDIGIPSCYSLFDKALGPLENLFTAVTKTSTASFPAS